MSVIDSSSAATAPGYQAAINASEMQRQSTEASLQSAFAVPGGRFGETVNGTESAALVAAIKAASVADYKRRIVLAAQFGQNDTPWRSALRTLLGTDFG
jgi:hypothetical protein